MKFSELPVKSIQELTTDAYLICNEVYREGEDDNVTNLSKTLLNVSNFANKEEINVLVEQNAKLVEIITSLVNQCRNLEHEIDQLKSSIKTSGNTNLDEVTKQLEELQQRLEDNIIEA